MTNDGGFANRLAHPRYGVPKTYLATVEGKVEGRDIQRLMRGVHLAEGRTRQARVRTLKRSRSRSLLEITIREGRNRQIRRMLARLKHPVRELVRTRIGRISLRGLGVGRSRRLTRDEVQYLERLATTEPKAPPHGRGPRKPGHGAAKRRKRRASGTGGGAGRDDAVVRRRRTDRGAEGKPRGDRRSEGGGKRRTDRRSKSRPPSQRKKRSSG
jgi:pseudouridine synthase